MLRFDQGTGLVAYVHTSGWKRHPATQLYRSLPAGKPGVMDEILFRQRDVPNAVFVQCLTSGRTDTCQREGRGDKKIVPYVLTNRQSDDRPGLVSLGKSIITGMEN